MGPIRSGSLVQIDSRASIAAVDSAHPNDSAPAAAALLRPLTPGRSRDAWVAVSTAAAQAGVSITVSLYGSLDNSAGSWRLIGQLNNGAPITPTVPAGGTSHTNRVAAAFSVPGLLGWPYVYPEVTGTIAAANTTVAVFGEDH